MFDSIKVKEILIETLIDFVWEISDSETLKQIRDNFNLKTGMDSLIEFNAYTETFYITIKGIDVVGVTNNELFETISSLSNYKSFFNKIMKNTVDKSF